MPSSSRSGPEQWKNPFNHLDIHKYSTKKVEKTGLVLDFFISRLFQKMTRGRDFPLTSPSGILLEMGQEDAMALRHELHGDLR